MFKRFGCLSDIFMANRRLANGSRFGFVQFKYVINEFDLEKKLSNIWIGNYRIRAHIANRDKRREYVRTHTHTGINQFKDGYKATKDNNLSYAEVVKRGNAQTRESSSKELQARGKEKDLVEDKVIIGSWKAKEMETNYIPSYAVGNMDKLEHFEAIQALI